MVAVIGVISAVAVACSGGPDHTDRSARTSRVTASMTSAAASPTTTPAPATTATTVAPSTTITTVPEAPAVPPASAQPPGCEGSGDVGQYLWGIACDGSPLQSQQGHG